jgi:cytochrome oxidase Cu insertion factor (SCO1/SenC/PrrC family)
MTPTAQSPEHVVGAGRGMLVALLSIAFMAGTGWLVAELVRPPAAVEAPAPVLDKASLLALVDHHGQQLTAEALDKPALVVFFGYTYCPDICPTELATMAVALDRLGAAAAEVGAFFVSVDPERDSPDHLWGYVELFHPRITGLTGEPAAIAAAAGAFRAHYERVEQGYGTYTVDHFARTLVLDRDGRLVAAIPFDSKPEVLEAALGPLLETSP